MIALDLSWDMLSANERGPKEDESIGGTWDV